MRREDKPVFRGSRADLQSLLRGEERYYIYVLLRPDGQPFYVGKGRGLRVFQHETEARHGAHYSANPYKINVIQKLRRSGARLLYEIDSLFDDEGEAYAREAELIAQWKRLHEGGTLTNLAPGGGSLSGPAPFSKRRHQQSLGGIPSDDPDRATINRFLLSLGKPKSICVKVLGRTTVPKPTSAFDHATRRPSQRQALALVASAIANGKALEAGVVIPRRFTYEGVAAFIENGVSNDIATSGLAEVISAPHPLDEAFRLNANGVTTVVKLIGEKKLTDCGLI